jgi:uncharacterized protein YabE (DUF348 family)
MIGDPTLIHNEKTKPTRKPSPLNPSNRKRSFGVMPIALLLMVIGAFAFGIWALNQSDEPKNPLTITLQVDHYRQTVHTHAETVGDFLEEHDIQLIPEDVIIPRPDTPLRENLRIIVQRARPVLIRVDGQEQIIYTTYESPVDILRSAQVTYSAYDRLTIDEQTVNPADLIAWPLPVDTISIVRAQPIMIVDGDNTHTLNTTGKTVGDALFEAEIDLFLSDIVTPPVTAPIEPNMTINIDRSRLVTILADERQVETRVNAQTVGGALAEAGFTLNGLDYSIPDETNELIPNTTIRIIRVTEEIITSEEIIPFEIIYQPDENLRLDTKQVIQSGENGIYRHAERVRYENGVEVSRIDESEGVVKVPQNGIVAYGTKIVMRTLDTPDGTIEYWRHLRMYATSYHPGSVGGSTGTSIGETLRKGIIAINPTIVRYRTNMYVPGYGHGFAADTGGPRRSPYWVDLGYSDEDWVGWSRWVDVYLLPPVPDNITYLLPESGNEGGPR